MVGTGRPTKRKILWLSESEEDRSGREDEKSGDDSTSQSEDMDESKQIKELEATVNKLKESEY